jgi:heat shock protein HtpX
LLGSYGLQTYIWNNRLRSLVLLAGFPFLLLLISFGFALVISALNAPDVGEGIRYAFELVPRLIPVALAGALVWFVIAWFANQGIIDAATGARKVEREEEPRLYNLLENLCISRGITMPALRIIDTDARNAFASGIREGRYSITVTRGLMNALSDAELEAVLGHELTHIRNRDVQLLVIAAVFVGIISLAGDLLIRSPRLLFSGSSSSSSSSGGGWSLGGGRSRSSSRSSGKGGGGAIVLILIAVAVFLIARGLALALRFAMSRKREFLADAGSVELTKNPDAMIAALKKISGRSEIAAPAQVQEMFLDLPAAGLFATHPSIDRRIEALVQYAGGHDLPLPPEPASAGAASDGGSAKPVPQFGQREIPPPPLSPDDFPPGPSQGPWG